MRVTMMVALSCLLCGCASSQDSYDARVRATEQGMAASAIDYANKAKAEADAQLADYDRRLETWKPQLRKYVACNKSAAQAVAAQSGDPISLAIGARSLCRAEEAKLQEAVFAAYSDNPAIGTQAMEIVRKGALERNTGEIVAYRANVNSTSAPDRSREKSPAAGGI